MSGTPSYHTCLHYLFERQASQTPDQVAVASGSRTLTFAELDSWANRIAHSLVTFIDAGEPVGVCAPRSVEMVAAMLGVLKAGGCYLPVGLDWPIQYFADIRTDAGCNVILKAGIEADRMLADTDIRHMDIASFDAPQEGVCAPVDVMTDPADLAYIIFTSGTTGRPKGVMVSHHAICNRLLWMKEEYRLDSSDRVLQKTPYTFDVSVWEIFLPLLGGAQLVLARPDEHRMADSISQLIQSSGITIAHFVPSMLSVFLQLCDPKSLSTLRLLICSGEALPYDTMQRCLKMIPCRLDNLYGPTEAAVDVSFWQCQSDYSSSVVPIGKPISNISFQVVDENLQAVSAGNEGELCISGIGLSRGYVNQPGLTAAVFVPNPASSRSELMYRTGDRVRLLPDGNLEYLGRGDRQVKIRGVRIELDAIEAILNKHDGVQAIVVVLRETMGGNRLVVAYVVLTEFLKRPVATEILRAFVGQYLPVEAIPDAFICMDALPLTGHGKLDREALPMPFQADTSRDNVPGTPLERDLAGLFQQLLDVPSVGRTADFWSLGGNSLKAAQLSHLIGPGLPATLVYQHRSIASLAEYLIKQNITRVCGHDDFHRPVRQSFRQVFTRHFDGLLAIESDKRLRARKQKARRWFMWFFPGKLVKVDHAKRFPYFTSFALALDDDPRGLNYLQRAATLVLSARELLFENDGQWGASHVSLWGYTVSPKPHTHWWALANRLAGALPASIPFGLKISSGSKTDEIVVLFRGNAYAVKLQAGVSASALADALEMLVSAADSEPGSLALGGLTGAKRITDWSRCQKKLKANQLNRLTLDRVRSAALVLCLVERAEDRDVTLLNELAADSPYRWHEKALQIIVTADSSAGIVFNHMAIDAVPASQFSSALQGAGAKTVLAESAGAASWETLPWDSMANEAVDLQSSAQTPGFMRKWFFMSGAGSLFWQERNLNESSAVIILIAIAASRKLGYLPLLYDTIDARHVSNARVVIYHPVDSELADIIIRLAQYQATDTWGKLFSTAVSICDARRQSALEGGDGLNWCLPVGVFTARAINDRITRSAEGHPCFDLITGVLSPVNGAAPWLCELGEFNACYFILEPGRCAVSLQGQLDLSEALENVVAEAVRYLAP